MVWGLLSDGDGWRLSKDGGNLGFNKGEGIGAYEKMGESCGLSNGGKLLSIKWGKVGGLSNEKGFGVSNEKGFGVYQKKGKVGVNRSERVWDLSKDKRNGVHQLRTA